MIFTFLTSRFLGLAKGWWLLIAIALLSAGYLWIIAREEADDRRNREIGASVQREGDLRTTLERVQEADRAEEKLDTDPDHRRSGCLRNSRTPENCD